MIRFLRILLASALIVLCGLQLAAAQTLPKLTGRVVDAAGLLSPEQTAQLNQMSESIEKASSRQLVVATIPDLQGYTVEEYGNALIRGWAIGQKGANNGIILIVAPNERKVRIEVGYGLEPIMTDALSSMIINETILPRFKAKDMPGGIIAGADAIAEQMKLPLEAAEARAVQQTSRPAPRARSNDSGGIPFVMVFWLVVLAFLVLSRLRRGTKGRRYRGGAAPVILWGPGLGGGSSGGWGSGWGSSGGSGWGGGGSDWGGGGGFSGGGGSGGGGGASGSW